MMFRSIVQTRSKLLPLLLAMLAACAPLCASAFSQENPPNNKKMKLVRVILKITVKDTNGNPVPEARITIPRPEFPPEQKIGPVSEKTGENGSLTRPKTDFGLTGSPHKLTVSPTEFTLQGGKLISDDELQSSDGNTYETEVTVIPTSVAANSGAATNQSLNGNTRRAGVNSSSNTNESVTGAGGGNGGENLGQGIYGWALYALHILNHAIWYSGFLFILSLMTVTALWFSGYRVLQYDPEKDRKPNSSRKQIADILTIVQRLERAEEIKRASTPDKMIAAVPQTPNYDSTRGRKQSKRDAQPSDEITTPAALIDSPSPTQSVPPSSTPEYLVQPLPPVAKDAGYPNYIEWLNTRPPNPEPIYLDNEGTSSVGGKLEDDSVYLTQFNNAQTTFVLFPKGNDNGLVFPNPALIFDHAALKEIFPDLTEYQFEHAKEQIKPVRAKRVGERRWRVDESSAV